MVNLVYLFTKAYVKKSVIVPKNTLQKHFNTKLLHITYVLSLSALSSSTSLNIVEHIFSI